MRKSSGSLPAIIEPIEVGAEEIRPRHSIGIRIGGTFTPDPDLVRKIVEELERRKRLGLETPTAEELKIIASNG